MGESTRCEPTTVYGASKAAGELYAQACMRTYGLPVIVVRPFNSYGPREHAEGTSAEVIPKFASRILAGEGAGDLRRRQPDPRLHLGRGDRGGDRRRDAACDELVGEAVNIAHGPRCRDRRDVCELLLEILDAERPGAGVRRTSVPGTCMHHRADTAKACEGLRIPRRGLDPRGPRALRRPGLGGQRSARLARAEPVRNW